MHKRFRGIGGMEHGDGVARIADYRLTVTGKSWLFAAEQAQAIDTHWQRRHAESPAMFNGAIHLLHDGAIEQGPQGGARLEGQFLRTDFKSYLYWREQGFPEAGVIDAFGSALIRSAEGHIVLGRQRAGNINSGAAYLPGGFIDQRDVAANGEIDIRGSILRELGEETGLTTADVMVGEGYIVTRWRALLSIALELVSPLPSEDLRARILQHIAGDPNSELTDAVIVRSASEIDAVGVHPYARVLLEWVFSRS